MGFSFCWCDGVCALAFDGHAVCSGGADRAGEVFPGGDLPPAFARAQVKHNWHDVGVEVGAIVNQRAQLAACRRQLVVARVKQWVVGDFDQLR